jgi:hypothetical protein
MLHYQPGPGKDRSTKASNFPATPQMQDFRAGTVELIDEVS